MQLVKFGDSPAASDKLTFAIAVDPAKQNYLTLKLYGSDTQFGVLHLTDLTSVKGEVVFDQIDNNTSNGSGNPPFVGRFHYATATIPLSMTRGKTSVSLSLVSTGYFYDAGGDKAGKLTRPVYSAFSHTDPYFVSPAADKTGKSLAQIGTEPPTMVDKATVYRVLKRSRANIYNLDGVPDGFWNPGGTLTNHGSVIALGTPGAPREVVGMHMWDGPLTAKQIQDINATASPADTWRNNVVGRQNTAISLYAAVYLTPPLKDTDGNLVAGYDKYLDPTMLDRLIGLMDGQARSQGGNGPSLVGWDHGCLSGAGWGGVTSTPRQTGPWAGSSVRRSGECISFAGSFGTLGRAMLRLLNNPIAAAAFKARLGEKIDAELDGKLVTRAAMYERMLAASGARMGFGLKALTSDDNFDKFGGTAAQAMIFVGNTYPAQLALRSLLALFPTSDTDKQPVDPSLMRTIIRQLMGLDDRKFMPPATPGWRIITKGGLSETYGSLASGYDGRYGAGIPVDATKLALLTMYDTAMSATDRDEAAEVVRQVIAAFDHFLYPQHLISVAKDGSLIDTFALGQEDVISWRVPYGPNANGWNLNLQPLAVDPNGSIRSSLARRAFLLDATRGGKDSLISDTDFYTELEAAWQSMSGVDPGTVPKLPGEPGAPDFVWADVDSGAFAMAYQGERLFFNAQYGRNRGEINNFVRLHHVTDSVDRQATVRMPFDSTTVLNDGNVGGSVNGAWVVRYGRYLAVLNRGRTAYTVQLPLNVQVLAMRAKVAVTSAKPPSVAAGEYEVFVLP